MNELYFRLVLVLAFVSTMSASNILAQDFCDGNFDYDQDVDGTDASTFKTDFGRSAYQNPCPPDGPAPVIKTGQTTIYYEGDDGHLAKGYTWPNPRFTDNEDYTVSDNLSGLMWTATAGLTGIPGNWTYAMGYLLNMNRHDGRYGYKDWRLPNVRELQSLIHYGFSNPALPNTAGVGQCSEHDPFTTVPSDCIWSSTTCASNTDLAWCVNMFDGSVYTGDKLSHQCYIWAVRGGQ